MLAYLVFVVISLVPTIAEQFIDFSNDTMSEHDWFDVLYIMMPMFVLGPIVQILGFVALWAQASEIKSGSPGTEDALGVKGLLVQGMLAWIAWWYSKGDGGEFEAEAATGERTALLA